ncbi:MAG TPA: DNA mismatch repair protein MutS [Hyphomicrobiales bacterium]|nr:DNA mismatch repair protein MutS [Hyphomicrobiales bacterium]
MAFGSILFPEGAQEVPERREQPDFFVDLALDQIVGTVTAGWEEYDLKPIFHTAPQDATVVAHRHAVMADLEEADIMAAVTAFSQAMRESRAGVAETTKMHYRHQREASFLDAVRLYCAGLRALAAALKELPIRSPGLRSFHEYLAAHLASPALAQLSDGADDLKRDLAAVRYTVLIRDGGFRVSQFEDEDDYGDEVRRTFEKFKQKDAAAYTFKFPEFAEINHIEAEVLKGVAILNPALFQRLDDYCERHAAFIDPVIGRFDREINFYISYLKFIGKFRERSLNFCYPRLALGDKTVSARESFDLALAHRLIEADLPVVCNDFHLDGAERIFVVSGPNQGGKTTFARTFGQMHYLASLGCPVPGRAARLLLYDRLFTHFEKEEALSTLRGKLHDDLVRIHGILEEVSPRSIVILNEIFNSTALQDAIFLARKILDRIVRLDCLCVCVTFMDELASLGPQTVSVASTVVPGNPAERTFKIVRKPADGLAYALSLAEKYRLTHDSLKERLRA